MSLTPNQKKIIKNKKNSVDSSQFAKQFSVDQELVDRYISEIKNEKTPKWFYLILLSIPIIFFILIEGALHLSDYGNDLSTFVLLSENDPDQLVFNPKYPLKFFNTSTTVPSVIPDPFDKIKDENSFRVFVLGGSTTAGFPFSYNASFSRYIKRRFEILYPSLNIEMINLGISAVNTYTVKDLIPDILKQRPDLVLIYAGHNEYYGALGVGSNESLGNSQWLVNFALSLKEFRTFQLLENFIYAIKNFGSETKKDKSRTLMAQMIGEDLIEYESDIYYSGLSQFKNNMEEVLIKLTDSGINTAISSITSNLLQRPFESIERDSLSADDYFNSAEKHFLEKKYDKAKAEFLLAKDKDALRFRAPVEINKIIKILAKKHNVPLVDIDSVFSSKSLGGITGYNLMVDHLHPTVEGHQILGESFFDILKLNSYLPQIKAKDISHGKMKKLMVSSLAYTRFDSTYANLTLYYLLNDYPFVKSKKEIRKKYSLENYSDSLAEKVVLGKISWEEGHLNCAQHFFDKKDYKNFVDEILVLIDDRPFIRYNYVFGVDKLKSVKKLDRALPILLKMDKNFPGYYSAKWLGTLALERKHYEKAIFYYEKAIKFKQAEAQIYFNISAAYFYRNQYKKAILALQKCLNINPSFPNAEKMLNNLLKQGK